ISVNIRLPYVTETFPFNWSLFTSQWMTNELGSLSKGHRYCLFQCPVGASCAPTFLHRPGRPEAGPLRASTCLRREHRRIPAPHEGYRI
uniref:Uncharacterized protein n=1 Tax=Cyprinus carpio TaxID=7962 RepID=A0A8C2HER0_CYPCA